MVLNSGFADVEIDSPCMFVGAGLERMDNRSVIIDAEFIRSMGIGGAWGDRLGCVSRIRGIIWASQTVIVGACDSKI
jgi:hypothetical protein